MERRLSAEEGPKENFPKTMHLSIPVVYVFIDLSLVYLSTLSYLSSVSVIFGVGCDALLLILLLLLFCWCLSSLLPAQFSYVLSVCCCGSVWCLFFVWCLVVSRLHLLAFAHQWGLFFSNISHSTGV